MLLARLVQNYATYDL